MMVEDVFLSSILVVFFIFFVFCLFFWILKAIGLSKIATDYGIQNAWLAWIPLADLYILGKVSDKIKKIWKIKNLGNLFLILSVVQLFFIIISIFIGILLPALELYNREIFEIFAIASVIFSIVKIIFEIIINLIVTVVLILKILAIYQIYNEYLNDDKKVLFLVLSIIFPFMQSVFLFIIKDLKPSYRGEGIT